MAELPQSTPIANSTNVAVTSNAWTGQGAGVSTNSGTANAWSSSNSQITVSAPPSVSVMPITTSTTAIPTVNAVPVASSTLVTTAIPNATASTLPMATATNSNVTIAQPPVLGQPVSTAVHSVPTSAVSVTGVSVGGSSMTGAPLTSHHLPPGGSPSRAPLRPTTGSDPTKVLDKQRLSELVSEVDPLEVIDDDVVELLVQVADDFIDNVVNSAAKIAKHRKSSNVETKDVQLHLERSWNMWIPGFGSSEEPKPYKKAATTEAHKQRMALIKKTLKKY